MSKHRVVAAVFAGCLALGGLSACAAVTPADDLNTVSLEVAGAVASPAPGGSRLGRRALHGEVVVQGRDGPRTVVAQRGTVTAKGDGTLTVRSGDGFTLTWTTNGDTRVRAGGGPAGLDQVVVGAQVRIGGVKGSPQPARLIVVSKAD
jgi:hypothetical protein